MEDTEKARGPEVRLETAAFVQNTEKARGPEVRPQVGEELGLDGDRVLERLEAGDGVVVAEDTLKISDVRHWNLRRREEPPGVWKRTSASRRLAGLGEMGRGSGRLVVPTTTPG